MENENNKEKSFRKGLVISETLNNKIEEIRKKMGMKPNNFFTAVVEIAINGLYTKTFPPHVVQRTLSASKTPEDRADEQIKIKEAKKQREEQEFMDIVALLEGRISLNEAGRKQVEFYQYDKGNRYFQKLPLHMMNEELVRDQYYPSREAVEKRQAEGKVNYKVGSWEN